MIRVVLPFHLKNLAGVDDEVVLELEPTTPVTLGAVLDALEARHPVLCGTIRHHADGARQPFLRYFADGEDLSHEPPDTPLPDSVTEGKAPFIVLGAIAGG